MVQNLEEVRRLLKESRRLLLDTIGHSADLTVLRSWGNRGDDLIFAGMRNLLRDVSYREYDIRVIDRLPPGQLAVISGGGSWCKPFHAMPALLEAAEPRFERVIVFPSSFDTEEPAVRQALEKTRAVVFARERESYEQIRDLCDARLALDTAFFFDFGPYASRFQEGVLHAFREDAEAAGVELPADNFDISDKCQSLDEWLWTISRHRLIRTDRAHVIIAAAMLGKQTEYRASSYHKVPALVDYSIPSNLVSMMQEQTAWTSARGNAAALPVNELARRPVLNSSHLELQQIRQATEAMRASWSWRITAPLRVVLNAALAVKRRLVSTESRSGSESS